MAEKMFNLWKHKNKRWEWKKIEEHMKKKYKNIIRQTQEHNRNNYETKAYVNHVSLLWSTWFTLVLSFGRIWWTQ